MPLTLLEQKSFAEVNHLRKEIDGISSRLSDLTQTVERLKERLARVAHVNETTEAHVENLKLSVQSNAMKVAAAYDKAEDAVTKIDFLREETMQRFKEVQQKWDRLLEQTDNLRNMRVTV